jgi:peptide/nickel transport system substrate-binding protein
MNKKRKLILLSLVLAIAMLITACGGGAPAPAPENGEANGETPAPAPSTEETLIVAQGADPVSLDPHATNDQPSSRVMAQIYERLVVQTEEMELEPGLAESWESIDDNTFEFKLREGVMFHNGEELKASDVEFTLLRALESTFIGHIVGAIDPEGIEIVDDYTIRISTTEPFAPILAHLAHTASSILNEKAVTEGGEDYGQSPVGTGPYQFDSWMTGDRVELVRFEDYHGTPANIARVVIRNVPENANRAIEVETGGAHIAYDIAPTDISRIEDNDDLIMLRTPNFSTTYVGFNCEKAPFDDVRVRQAINYAVNMDAIVEAVYRGAGSPSKGPLGPNVWASNQNLEPYGYDVERAKELMAEAGYADGFSTTIWSNENQQRIDIAEILQNQLREIGITAEAQVLEWGAYLDGTAAGEHDMFILGWVTVTGDPDYGLYALFHSGQHGAAGNRTFYTNARVDELLDLGRVSVDADAREAAYLEAQELIRDDAPWIFTWTGEELTATRDNITGFKNHPAGHHKLFTVSFQ